MESESTVELIERFRELPVEQLAIMYRLYCRLQAEAFDAVGRLYKARHLILPRGIVRHWIHSYSDRAAYYEKHARAVRLAMRSTLDLRQALKVADLEALLDKQAHMH